MRAQIQQTQKHPHRRLEVVRPKSICADCIHANRAGMPARWTCAIGEKSVDHISGEDIFGTFCIEKNENGECADFVTNEEEVEKEKSDVAMVIFGAVLVVFGFYGFISFIQLLSEAVKAAS